MLEHFEAIDARCGLMGTIRSLLTVHDWRKLLLEGGLLLAFVLSSSVLMRP